jgi:transcriptional regulator with XRE-family HTH domain
MPIFACQCRAALQVNPLMMKNDNNKWYGLSDRALLKSLGQFLKSIRLEQNKTQQQFAEEAGISRSTVVQIENGSGGTLTSFIQMMRTLEQLHLFRYFETPNLISPILLAKQESHKRRRARHKNKPNTGNPGKTETDW